jgi:hypothetical protein
MQVDPITRTADATPPTSAAPTKGVAGDNLPHTRIDRIERTLRTDASPPSATSPPQPNCGSLSPASVVAGGAASAASQALNIGQLGSRVGASAAVAAVQWSFPRLGLAAGAAAGLETGPGDAVTTLGGYALGRFAADEVTPVAQEVGAAVGEWAGNWGAGLAVGAGVLAKFRCEP